MVKKASIAKEYLDSSSVNYTNRSDNFITTYTTVLFLHHQVAVVVVRIPDLVVVRTWWWRQPSWIKDK